MEGSNPSLLPEAITSPNPLSPACSVITNIIYYFSLYLIKQCRTSPCFLSQFPKSLFCCLCNPLLQIRFPAKAKSSPETDLKYLPCPAHGPACEMQTIYPVPYLLAIGSDPTLAAMKTHFCKSSLHAGTQTL